MVQADICVCFTVVRLLLMLVMVSLLYKPCIIGCSSHLSLGRLNAGVQGRRKCAYRLGRRRSMIS
jgi:hypothetical protein